jgi:hypothetical protein
MSSLFTAIESFCPEVTSISFARNQISSLDKFHFIKFPFKRLVNVSFESNNLQTLVQLDPLKALSLRELYLKDNPLATGIAPETYKS